MHIDPPKKKRPSPFDTTEGIANLSRALRETVNNTVGMVNRGAGLDEILGARAAKDAAEQHGVFSKQTGIASALALLPAMGFPEGKLPGVFKRAPKLTEKWAVITAENPAGKAGLTAAENGARQKALAADLAKLQKQGKIKGFEQGRGGYTDPDSKQLLHENPFIVKGIDPALAEDVARKHGQGGVVTNHGYHNLEANVLYRTKGMNGGSPDLFTELANGTRFAHDIDFGGATEPLSRTFDHYSPRGDLTELDPKHMGTGSFGAEAKRPDRPQMMHVYEQGAKPEPQFKGMPKYAVNARGFTYDLGADPLGLYKTARAKANSPAEAADRFERSLKDAGFTGYNNSGYYSDIYKLHGTHPVERADLKRAVGDSVVARGSRAALAAPWMPPDKVDALHTAWFNAMKDANLSPELRQRAAQTEAEVRPIAQSARDAKITNANQDYQQRTGSSFPADSVAQRIAAAAVRFPDGTVGFGPTHYHAIEQAGRPPEQLATAAEGYLTQQGKFVNRSEGENIFLGGASPGQRAEYGPPSPDGLHSGDINHSLRGYGGRQKGVLGPDGSVRGALADSAAAPAVRAIAGWTPTERGVFDRSAPKLQGTAPIDPRLAIPTSTRTGVSPFVQKVVGSRTVQRGLLSDAEAGLPIGGEQWYELGPVKADLDQRSGGMSFNDLANYGGAGSIQNPTTNELASLSLINWIMQRPGATIADAVAALSQATKGKAPGPWINGQMMTNARRAVEAGTQLPKDLMSDSWKVPWYTQGKHGGAPGAGVALDTHERRRLMQLALANPQLKRLAKAAGIAGQDQIPIKNALDYDALSGLYRQGASQLGLPSSQAFQAGRWLGGAAKTDLKSAPFGDYTQTLEDGLLYTARNRGMHETPADLRALWGRIQQGNDFFMPIYTKGGFPVY